MKFRNYVITALIVTVLVPFIAWSILQWQDINSTLMREDRDQRLFTGIGSVFIVERLKGIETFANYVDSELTKAYQDDLSEADIQQLLTKLTKAQPYLTSLRVVPVNDQGLFPPIFKWQLQSHSKFNENELTFTRPVSSNPKLSIIGTADRDALFKDIAAMFNMRRVRFVLIDESHRYIWPKLGLSGKETWGHPLKREGLVHESDTDFWVTANRFSVGAPSWTMLAIKPQSERVEQREALIQRTIGLALLMVLLTIVVGYFALRPLTRALKQLRFDLDDQGYASESTTIKNGPLEFKEVQRAYRDLRERLDLQNRTLQTHNSQLVETVDQRSRALATQERLFSMVFDDIQEGMLLLDEHWHIQHANPAAKKMLPDLSLHELVNTCRTSHQKVGNNMIFYEPENHDQNLVFECTVLPFGTARAEGEKGFCLLFSDVTGKAVVERMKNDLISIVAHELRTPVTACRLQLDLMVQEHGRTTAIEALLGDLEHLSHIIDDWLAVAKIDGGTYRVEPRIVQLMPLVSKAIRMVRTRYTFSISLHIAEEAECLFVDPNAFIELLVNLLTNACRYARKGEIATVEFHAYFKDMIVIEVVDYGIGFPAEASRRIFDRFFQLENGNKRRTGGTGLGLVICQAICEAHGGSIVAERKEEKTVFRISLPSINTTESLVV